MAIVDSIRGPVWIYPELEGGLEIALSAELGEDIVSIVVEMLGESAGPNIHNFLQSGKECVDQGRLLLLLHGWFGFSQMQVPKPISDEVQAAEGDPLARLHLLHGIVDVDDDSHLKHNIKLNAKGPYLARQLSDY